MCIGLWDLTNYYSPFLTNTLKERALLLYE